MSDWKLEKRIDLSMILSAIIVVAGIFVWAGDVNVAIAEVHQKILSIEKDIQETRNYIYRLEKRLNQGDHHA